MPPVAGAAMVFVMGHRHILIAVTLTAALAAAASAPASASLSDEVRAGQALAQQLQAGKTDCDRLSTDDFEHLGEYVMGRMAGSLQLHDAMNERLRSVMGADNEERMHVLMGQRYGGCASTGSVGPMMGSGMMTGRGWTDDGTWGPMMNARAWDWMRDGNWQRMSRDDWERVSNQWMGPGMMRAADTGWRTRDYLLAGVGIFVAATLLGTLLTWRRRRADAVTH